MIALLRFATQWVANCPTQKATQRVANRYFYELEAARNGWTRRQLERQIHSFYYERLLKSRDKAGMMELANQGEAAKQPVEVIKDPYVLGEENQQIFASRYKLQLPSEEDLRLELQRERRLIQERTGRAEVDA